MSAPPAWRSAAASSLDPPAYAALISFTGAIIFSLSSAAGAAASGLPPDLLDKLTVERGRPLSRADRRLASGW